MIFGRGDLKPLIKNTLANAKPAETANGSFCAIKQNGDRRRWTLNNIRAENNIDPYLPSYRRRSGWLDA